MIEKDYVNDGIGGGSNDDVCRLMGEVILHTLEYHRTVSQIMERGGFFIKIMV